MSGSSTQDKATSQSGTQAQQTNQSQTQNQTAIEQAMQNATQSQATTGSTTGQTQQNQNGTTQSSTTLWAPQASAIADAIAKAQEAYKTASTATAPTDFTAGMTPEQVATFKSMVGYGGDGSIPNAAATTGSTLAHAGTDGVTGALTGLAGFDASKANNPDALIAAANKYVAGQDIDAQVNHAMLNARQTARDVTLPGIEQNAATSGNTNSTRTGVAQGLVERGLAQQSADLGATMRSKAFNDGLSLASSNANANNTTNLGALSTAGDLGNATATTGLNAGSNSISDMIKLFTTQAAGGAGLQEGNQATLTNEAQKFASQTSSPYAALQGLMDIIGKQTYGSQTTGSTSGSTTGTSLGTSAGTTNGTASQTSNGSSSATGNATASGTMNGTSSMNGTEKTTSTPSAWQIIGGLLGGLGQGASTAGSLGWKPFA
jgi:hypothetical protein